LVFHRGAISHASFERKGTSPQENREVRIRETSSGSQVLLSITTFVDETLKARPNDVGAFRRAAKNPKDAEENVFPQRALSVARAHLRKLKP
jgi:hypothetical protein